ncbi:BCCT family transporter [Schaalia sp. 19OD2882]|uniref:BCCT family transporter n=1 Tax=Schaalia sp. 19OD2882 TaxID=2794089 RepID=UPI001C1F0C3C|nr:BCCT family transporter [Schaalia sp. 19OD2882]QWW19384.1 BCCT family transporter [Schaalia sp. 19OD2882]
MSSPDRVVNPLLAALAPEEETPVPAAERPDPRTHPDLPAPPNGNTPDPVTAPASSPNQGDDQAPAPSVNPDQPESVDAAAEAPVNWRVAIAATVVVLLFLAPALLVPHRMKDLLQATSATVINSLGWYYTLIVVGFVAFALFLAVSRFGDITLGPDDEEPTYSRTSWFAMLFAAGMGIGLVFWGVAEPLSHYTVPPPGTDASSPADVAQTAMTTTFLHWGLSAWAIYVVVGVAVAYMSHRRGRPVSLRWVLEPLLGERVRGWLGDLIDVTALVGTLFGVATSLGFGATQFTSGMEFLGLVTSSPIVFVIVVIVISALAALSVASGLDAGIKFLSNANLVLAGLLMVAMLVLGPTLFILRELVQTIGQYVEYFIQMSFRTLPYQGGDGEAWLGSWTTYYWGWWMSWSPFVGVFIARISRGRSVREFVTGVLLVPTLLTFLWFSILGGTALWHEMHGAGLTATPGWTTTALFKVADLLPGGPVLTGLFMVLLVVFFVTSSDSASFVLGMLSANGSHNPPLALRLLWAGLQGGIAALLLWVGASQGAVTDGLSALQVLSILTALPFSVVMVSTCVSMTKAFDHEHQLTMRAERALLRERITSLVEHTVDRSHRRRAKAPDIPMFTSPRSSWIPRLPKGPSSPLGRRRKK